MARAFGLYLLLLLVVGVIVTYWLVLLIAAAASVAAAIAAFELLALRERRKLAGPEFRCVKHGHLLDRQRKRCPIDGSPVVLCDFRAQRRAGKD